MTRLDQPPRTERPPFHPAWPIVAMGGRGDATVVWQRISSTRDHFVALAKRRAGSAKHWSRAHKLGGGPQNGIRMVMNRVGDTAVTFEGRADGRWVLLAAVRSHGRKWRIGSVYSASRYATWAPDVGMDAAGDLTIAWRDTACPPTPGNCTDRAMAVRRPAGGHWGIPAVLGQPAGAPHVAMGGGSTATVVYPGPDFSVQTTQGAPTGPWADAQSISNGLNAGVKLNAAMDALGHTTVISASTSLGCTASWSRQADPSQAGSDRHATDVSRSCGGGHRHASPNVLSCR